VEKQLWQHRIINSPPLNAMQFAVPVRLVVSGQGCGDTCEQHRCFGVKERRAEASRTGEKLMCK